MLQTTEPPIIRRRMSLEEYMELPEKPKSEWVRGEALIMPPARTGHQLIISDLIVFLRAALPDCYVIPDAGFRMPEIRRIPDIMVLTQFPGDEVWVDDPPLIAIEIISPATRSQDMIHKSVEYLAAGVGQYWIVDRKYRRITILKNNGSNWAKEIILDDKDPELDITIDNHGTIHLNINEIFGM